MVEYLRFGDENGTIAARRCAFNRSDLTPKNAMSQALYRKWRSQKFNEVIGQDHVTRTLQNALRDDRVAHAYLFSGPRGTGKTSTARILAAALNCTGGADDRPCGVCATCQSIREGRMLDLIEIDAASNNGVDDIRELRDKVSFRPSEGRYKIYIIDEVHMLSGPAFNALLKTLEEPPPHARFVLATTEPHKIPATVISRCQRFDFRRIPGLEIARHLRHVAGDEGFEVEEAALNAIARSAQGCMRDAVSLLDQMLSYGAEEVTLKQVNQVLGVVGAEAVNALVDSIATQAAVDGLTQIQSQVVEGANLPEFCQQILDHLRGVMVMKMTGDPALLEHMAPEAIERMEQQAAQIDLPRLLHALKMFSDAIPALKGGYQPQLPLEMALLEAISGPEPAPSVAAQGAPVRVDPRPAQPATGAAQPAPATVAPKAEVAPELDSVPMDPAAMAQLQAGWKEIQAMVRAQCGHKVQAALRSVRDMAASESVVALAFGNNQFAMDMIAKPETLQEVAGLISTYLNRNVQIECQIGMHAQIARAIGAASTEGNDGPDPLIEYAVGDLGAELG